MMSFEEIKSKAEKLVSNSSARDTMFDEIVDMYWMEDKSTKLSSRDEEEVKLTISPSARNEVVGMVRLLTTSSPHFKATAENGDPDKIEQALDKIIKRSNAVQMAKVETEACRCAVLCSDVHLMVECVDDLLAIKSLSSAEKARLTEIRKRTPFLVTAIFPREGYPIWGRYGLRAYLRKYKANGDDLVERWGVAGLKSDKDYTVWDWYDLENRAVWLEEQKEPILFKPHGMKQIPIVARLSDGTNLFKDEDKKRQPFLYAKWKGGLWKRENLLLTSLFTSMFERGTGPLFAIDPTSLPDPNDPTVEINYAGATRYVVGRVQPINDKAFDRDLIEAKGLLDQVGGESTIYKQTLGQAPGSSQTPFSSLSLMSMSGRLPLTSPQDAVSEAFKEVGEIILRWIKDENIQTPLLKASEIPDDLELECSLEIKLPQDTFRNAQVGAQLKGLVSKEWIHSNLLQVDNSEAMTEQIWSEQAADLMYQMMMQQFIEQIKQAAQAQALPAGPQNNMLGQSTDGLPAGPEAEMAGAEQMPMTEPMQPRGEPPSGRPQ